MHPSSHPIKFKSAIIALFFCGLSSHQLQADTVLYNNGKLLGTPWANGSMGIDHNVLTQQQEPTLKFTATENYANGGLNFYASGPVTIPKDASILQVKLLSVDAEMNGFVARISTGDQNFDSKHGTWQIDGQPGQVNALTPGEWHTLSFDLSSAPNFEPGISQLQGDGITLKVNKAGSTVHFGDIRLVERSTEADVDIPEPSSYAAVLGISAILLPLARRRMLR
jgi:hypothetical protein